jgi:molecular chaperone GrpE (heat shock protein)
MSHKRQVWETFSELAHRLLEAAETAKPQPTTDQAGTADLAEMAGELKRMGKAQFRANTLQEAALDQLRQMVDQLGTREREARDQAQADKIRNLLTALVPVLDGVQAALDSGERLLANPAPNAADDRWVARHRMGEVEKEPASHLILPSDRALMVAWLEGLRLVRERLLTLLVDAGVAPIPTVGQPFDPYLHQAVGTAYDSAYPSGFVVAEQRRGYTSPAGVLRYAEVIVNQDSADSESRGSDAKRQSTNLEIPEE